MSDTTEQPGTEEQPECDVCTAAIDHDGYCLFSCQWGPNQCDDCGACICDGAC